MFGDHSGQTVRLFLLFLFHTLGCDVYAKFYFGVIQDKISNCIYISTNSTTFAPSENDVCRLLRTDKPLGGLKVGFVKIHAAAVRLTSSTADLCAD